MPSTSELLSRATTNQSNVTQFLKLQPDLEQIISVLNLDQSYKLTSETLHVICGVIYLYHAEVLSKETINRLNRISMDLSDLTSKELKKDEYNRRAMPFLFTGTQIDPMIARLNLSKENTLSLRRIVNEISKLQLHNPDFFIALLNALQIKEMCSELLATQSCATTHRNDLLAAPSILPSKPPPKTLPKHSSSTEFVIVPIFSKRSSEWDELDELDELPKNKGMAPT